MEYRVNGREGTRERKKKKYELDIYDTGELVLRSSALVYYLVWFGLEFHLRVTHTQFAQN